MSVIDEDGPGGLECDHRWDTVFSLNNLEAALPRARLNLDDGITGLFDLPDTSDDREKRTAQIGEQIYPTIEGGKTVVYKGELEAPDQPQLGALRQAMRHAFQRGQGSEKIMAIVPHASWGTAQWGYFSKLLPGGLMVDPRIHRSENHPRGVYAHNFQLSLRMSDPRFLLLTDYKIFGAASGATVVADNLNGPDGAPADPKFTIAVPGGNPDVVLENLDVTTSNGTARLRFNDVPAGELVVDFKTGARFADLDGDDAMQFFDSAYSQWWDEFIPGIAPGDNHIKVTGGGWTVEYFPRCW